MPPTDEDIVEEVVSFVDSWLRSKGLDSQNESDKAGQMVLRWRGEEYKSSLKLVEQLIQTLIKELVGDAKCIYTHEDGSPGVNLDFEQFKVTKVVDCLESVSHHKFPEDKFSQDTNTGKLLDLVYKHFLPSFKEPQFITDFPEVCCKVEEGGSQRFDVVVLGKIVCSTIIFDNDALVSLDAQQLTDIVDRLSEANMADRAFPEEWQLLANTKMDEVPDLLEKMQEALNDMWKGRTGSSLNASMTSAGMLVGRSQAKIVFLMSTVATDLLKYCQRQLTENARVDLWRGNFNDVRTSLQQAMVVVDTWTKMTEELTGVHWQGEWTGPKWADPTAKAFSDRLEKILNLRTTHDQLCQLLAIDEMRELRIRDVFNPFSNVDSLDVNSTRFYTWDQAVRHFERLLEPIEQRVAMKLRSTLTSVANQPHTILAEFQRYQVLIQRPAISSELSQERDTLLVKLAERIDSLRADFDVKSNRLESDEANDEDRQNQTGRNMPGIVNAIVWTRQVKDRVTQTLTTCKQLLSDLPRLESFSENCTHFIEELTDYERDLFKNWQEDVLDRMGDDDEPIGVDTSKTLMKITSDGRIRVNFSERLVEVMKEVRQLLAIGFNVPKEIIKLCHNAAKFYRHGVALKQVANFYNTMDKELIKSHLAILLEPAKQFESVVSANKKKGVTWNRTDEAEKYISDLKSAANGLTGRNKRLKQVHEDFADKVNQLMDIDLLTQEDKWAQAIKVMRNKFYELEHGYGFKNLDQWKAHWDHQLYKALEHQYQRGLESLNENLTELKCELVFRSETIMFRPSVETIREKYYHKMKEFIAYPASFRGVGDSDFFKFMPNMNGDAISTVYGKAEQLFAELKKVKKIFREHVLLGTVDLEAVVHDSLTEVHQWEANFKMVKAKGKEVSAIDNFLKVDCISVSTAPIKATIEDHLQRLGDLLTASLKKAAQDHVVKIDEFLTEAFAKLDIKPENIDEIGQANQCYGELKEAIPTMQAEFTKFEAKSKLLKSVAGHAPDLGGTKKRWESFLDKLNGIEKVIEAQLEKMKAAVDESVATFMTDFGKFQAVWDELKPKDIEAYKTREDILEKGILFMKNKRKEFDELNERAHQLTLQCKYFGMAEPEFTAVEDTGMNISDFEEMWNLYETFDEELQVLANEEWFIFRVKTYLFDDFLRDWGDKIKELPSNNIVLYIRDRLDKWTDFGMLLKLLRGDGFTLDHWLDLFRLCEMGGNIPPESLKFLNFLDQWQIIVERADDIKALHLRAQGEIQIRDALQEIRTWSGDMEFTLLKRTEGGRTVHLISEWKEVMTAVSDMQSLLGSIKDSPYFVMFADEAQAWEKKFIILDEVLLVLSQIQRKWVYLEPIFSKGALPSEQGRFQKVDKEFVDLLKKVEKEKLVITLAKDKKLPDKLTSMLDQLGRCQKALQQYLEEKRDRFPRFYFIGDDDLLEILGQAQNPSVIQAHLKKLFAGIHRVEFNESETHITAMKSSDGEVVPLINPVEIKREVEVWLRELDLEMKETLRQLLWQCVEKTDFVKFPSQVLNLSEAIHFTMDTEKAINDRTLEKHRESLLTQLDDYTNGDDDDDHLQQLKMKALVLDLIHNIEVIDQLIAKNCTSLQDWAWRKQLRFYFDEKRSCILRMVDAKFNYTYEYQGNAPKLVHTPLTDKCYLTLTQGMHLGYGGNPYGPAGTGKTESVKALGNAMGRQVLVFNCDEGIDFKSMGRIFQGLCKCGAWGCFDEFNRLKEDQLSAISQMIQVIQDSIKKGESTVHFLEKTINLNLNAGIFVTLNPAGKAYGGRSNLPDNLKQLFRAVAMTAPDNTLIAETELYSEGFKMAKKIGHKVVEIFALSKQLLSPQQHYDWGLRPLKTILKVAGSLIHQERNQKSNGEAEGPSTPKKTFSEEEQYNWEASLVIKSLRVNTLSKLTFDDSLRFNDLVKDVFPGVKVEDIVYQSLTEAVIDTMKEMNLQVLDNQLQKVMQLYESLNQRMGVVIVGPSGAGKSTLLKVLRAAQIKMGMHMPRYDMNPKAMNREQLLGHMDIDTREWYDGVLTAASRKVVQESLETQSWIVCDGDIDPEWIESLNSVLDDNRLLTMPNGERIQFGNNINFVFETHSLAFASPATVSRMAVIYLSEEDVDPTAPVKSWLSRLPEDIKDAVAVWVDDYFYKAIDILKATKALCVETTMMALVNSGLSHISKVRTKVEFVIGLIRGLGPYLQMEERTAYALELYKLCGEKPLDASRPLDTYVDEDFSPPNLYSYSMEEDLELEGLVKEEMIPTLDAQRNLDIVRPWVEQARPFVLVGPEGAGKAMIVNNLTKHMKNTDVATINCSAQTTCQHVIQKLNQVCTLFSTNVGRALKPKDCDRLLLFLKDLNLPRPDAYATVQLHAFLSQLILYKGFYNKDLEWIGIANIQIIASMNPQGGIGRYPLSSRFTAILSVCYVAYPPKDQLQQIYTEYLRAVMTKNPALEKSSTWGSGKPAEELAETLVTTYDQTKSKHTQDQHSHYVFTPRDLTRWVVNLLNYDLETNDLLDCIYYEASRLFSDRLVDQRERDHFDMNLTNNLSMQWQYEKKESEFYFVSWLDSGSSSKKKSKKKNKRDADVTTGKRLVNIKYKDFKKAMDQAKLGYSREYRDLDLMDLRETFSWICRSDRILAQDGGSMLVTGRSGVGRRNVVALAAYMMHMPVYTLNMTKDYSLKNFKLDLRAILQRAGIQGEHVCLIIEDHNLTNSEFLEIINSLLASGEVPGLYTPEELGALLVPIMEEMSAEGFVGGAFAYFVHRVQARLHVCLLMDPTNADYEMRCQSNPALYTKCAVQWMGTWSAHAYNKVPGLVFDTLFKLFAKANPEETKDDAKAREDAIGKDLLTIHDAAPGVLATPRMFTQFCKIYEMIYIEKQGNIIEQKRRLNSGLSKLQEAEVSVGVLSEDAEVKKVELTEKQAQADEALEEIQRSMEKSSEQKKEVSSAKKKISKESSEMSSKKKEIEKKLSGIEPILNAAREAVHCIKAENLTEIRGLKMPPDPIRDVLEGVLCVMGIYDTSWISMKRFLGQRGVKDRILRFDAKDISPEIRDSVKSIIDSKPSSFKPEVIQRASVAAAPLAQWVVANIEYSTVLESVAPLLAELEKCEKTLAKSQKKLDKADEELKKLEKNVKSMKKTFTKMTGEAEKLKEALETAEGVLQGAQDLLGKLGGERDRWHSQCQALDMELEALPKASLCAAAFITYLGASPEDERRGKIKDWCSALQFAEFDFQRFMRTESQLLQYKSEGLPADELSIQNSIIILQATQTPLIVDPASQAVSWLTQHLSNQQNTVEVTPASDARFGTSLELAVRFGKILIVTEVDKVDALLYPILRKDLMSAGPKKTIQIGDKQVDWHDNFRLFLVTRDTHIQLPPDAKSLVTEVNFAITRSGLEGQFLGVTIQHEKPELEEQKSKLLQQEEEYKMQLSELEDILLRDLANSEGSLLENKVLIDSLNQIKTKSLVIVQSLEEARTLQESLDRQRNAYRPFANAGSKLFFLAKDLPSVNHMYQFSLSVFTKLFQKALAQNANMQGDISDKIKALQESLYKEVYYYVCRSLLKEDRHLFGMHMCHGLFPESFEDKEWDVFTGRTVAAEGGRAQPPTWMDPDSLSTFRTFEASFPRLLHSMNLDGNADNWYRWMRSKEPEINLPSNLQSKFTPFQHLLIVQTFRPDRVPNAMEIVIMKMLKVPTANPPVTQLGEIVEDERLSCAGEPILLVTTPGADPSQELQELAEKRVGKEHFFTLAMGGGQAERAIELLRKCSAEGSWLCLKNLHLVVAWVPELEKEFNLLEHHEKFRLWLTSEPHSKFPALLLTQSLKITFEAPPGIKNNMMKTYSLWQPDMLAAQSKLCAQVLFVLSWFHAIVQERRNYIPQGWGKFYEFSLADLRCAADIIVASCKVSDVPDWLTIHELFENAIYGGRMDNTADVRILRTYLNGYFNFEILGLNPNKPTEVVPASRRSAVLVKGLNIPASNNHADFVASIATLPDTDGPQPFMLPANADRLVQRRRTQKILDNLNRLGTAGSVGGGFNREQWAQNLQPVLTLWTTLTKDNLATFYEPAPPPKASMSPVEAFVALELANAKHLVRTVGDVIKEIQEVIAGTALLSSKVQKLAQNLMEGDVPLAWDKLWEGPEQILLWLRGIMLRAVALLRWQALTEKGELLRSKLNLQELFRPHTFLNALRQETARKTQLALDDLVLDCVWGEGSVLSKASVPIQVEGLFVQGGKFEGQKLVEVLADSAAVSPAPVCSLGWVLERDKQNFKNLVSFPVYHSGGRDKLLCELLVPCQGDQARWILTGFAVLLEA